MAFDVTRQELLKQANDLLRLFRQTRDKKYKDEEIRLRRIVSELEEFTISGGSQDLQDVTDLGATTTDAIETGGVKSDYFLLDTSATPTPEQGMMFWDSDRSTVNLQLNGVVAKLGQDNYWYVKNQSGSTIPKGKVVMAVGTLGASGRILIDEMVADGSVSAKYIIGVTAEEITNGSDGFVMNIGKLRQVNTSMFAEGSVLYCSPTTPGNFTTTKPASPNLAMPIAFVVHSAANGTLAIRVSTVDENATGGGGSLYTQTITAYRTTNQPSGTFMDLSTDGSGVSGLIEPTTPNATWNVTIDTIATVIGITGDVTGIVIGDTYSETTRLVFKKVSGISTLVAIVSSEAGFDSSMTTALMNYSVGGTQNLNLQFQFPTFAGAGSIEINAISKLEIVEATY